MLNPCTGCGVSLAVLYAVATYLNHATAIQVTSTGPQKIQKPQGDSVTLGCTYSESPSDTGQLDVEWSRVSQDMTQKDILILSYSSGQQYQLGSPELMSRLKFVADPSSGDASISITGLQVSDTSTYQCKVKKPPGIDSRKVTLVVLVPPSVPKCWVEGGEEIGGSVSMRCKSSRGSIPLTYTWTRESGNMPPTTTQNSQTGELLISNHSQSYTGSYLCEVSNDVGKQQCKYLLRAYNPVNKAGVIAGAVIGALLLLLLLLLLICLLIVCCRKRRHEKESANEIKEDAAAPESRPNSRHTSFRSIMGYRTHQGIYSSVRSGQPNRAAAGRSSIYTDPPLHVPPQSSSPGSDYKPPLSYDSTYGYAV